MPKRSSFWSSELEEITDLTHGEQVETDREATSNICETLDAIFSGAIANLREDKHKNVSVEGIQNAIQKLFPPSMADHAMSEGFKEILSYNAMPFDFTKKKLDVLHANLMEKIKMQDEKDLKRSYANSVSEVVKNSHADAKLDKNSNLRICRILDSMSMETIRRLKDKNADKLTLEEAQEIVKSILPKKLSDHAAAEGNKMLFKFESRGLRFVPGASAHQRVQEKLKPVKTVEKFAANGLEYKSGVGTILKLVNPGLKFNQSGQKVACQKVDTLCDVIMEKAGKKGAKKTQADIEKAVQALLPPVMAEHAIAEAKKMIKRNESGGIHKSAALTQGTSAKKPKQMDLKLEDGFAGITQMTHAGAKMEEGASDRLSGDINKLLSALIQKMKDSKVKKVTTEEIKKAIDSVIVPPTINEHANSEGEKMVELHEMQKFVFLPKRRRT